MDIFLKSTHKEFTSKSLHLIGVSCMIIASKFNDTRYITIEAAYRFISNRELKENELVIMENEIFKTVNDSIGMILAFDIISVLCEKYKVGEKVRRTAITILYLMQMYYDSLKYSINEQAFSIFFISLYSLRQRCIIEEVCRDGDCIVDLKIIGTMHAGI